jgi:hypothetical protein
MTETLDYDRARTPTPMIALHYIALVCALGPMIGGVLVFLLFAATSKLEFAALGLLAIVIGCAAAFIGGVCLAVYWYQARHANPDDAAVARRRAKRDLILLLANFPLAGVLTVASLPMMGRATGRVTVAVRNDDAVIANLVTLDTGGDTRRIGPIPPGGEAHTPIKFGPAGLTATLTRGGGSAPAQRIFEHMDSDTVGGGTRVRLAIRDGKIVIRDE